MRYWPPIGVRGRVVLVLALLVAAALALLALGSRPLMVPRLALQRAERLGWAASAAAAGVPADPASWDAWLKRVQAAIPGARVFLIRNEPGQPAFMTEVAALGIDPDKAREAFIEGGSMVTRGSVQGEAQTWVALVRVVAADGTKALLGICEPAHAAFEPASVFGVWLVYALVSFMLAFVAALVLGHFLLARPVRAAATSVARLVPNLVGPDIELPRMAIGQVATRVREAEERADRLRRELARIRADLKGAEATLLRAEKLASVGQLAAGIAHEVGNPVGIILGMAEVIATGTLSEEETRQFASQIRAAGMRVHSIIRDLLAFARPARDEGAVANVAEVIAATVKLLAPQKRFKGIEVNVEVREADLKAEIRPSQLQQILVNLLLNAADAMGGKGTVRVVAGAEERWALISVSDNGPGIPEEDQSRIFDPFFTTKPPGEGTGLGLPICAQICEVYGGEITVASEPGKGACFTVRLWRPTEVTKEPS